VLLFLSRFLLEDLPEDFFFLWERDLLRRLSWSKLVKATNGVMILGGKKSKSNRS
jgi:hypothetical protein